MFHSLKYMTYAALFLVSAGLAAEGPEFSTADPRGDDFGAGTIRYPSSIDFDRGDLDLVEFSAESGKKGTWFTVRFAREVKSPANRMSRAASIRLEDLLRFDFFNLNVDIYIDTDGVPGSGNTTTVPGRSIAVHRATAWEKAIVLTPRPVVARSTMESYMNRSQIVQREAAEGTLPREAMREARRQVKQVLEEQFFFPTRINVNNRSIQFFVEESFLGGPASPDWAYLVLITGSDPEQAANFDFLNQPSQGLMQMPLTGGRPFESFQIEFDSDPAQPPVIDVLLPSIDQQVALLRHFDTVSGRLAVLPGIRPSAPDQLPESRFPNLADRGSTLPRTAAPRVASPPADRAENTKTRPAQKPDSPTAVKPTEMQAEPVAADPLPEQTTVKPSPAEKPAVAQPPAKPKVDRLLDPKPVKKRVADRSIAERLRELKGLLDEGLITEEEYQELRRKILNDL